MTTIRISECKGYTKATFLRALRRSGENSVIINIPKYADDQPGLLVQDYFRALYVGQLFGRISTDIGHSIPDPARPGEFSFHLTINRWEELAGILVYIYPACSTEELIEDEKAFFRFQHRMANFLYDMPEDEIIYCPYFLHVIEQYDR